MSNLQNNTTSLQAILEQVNGLPENSGGSSVETCKITIVNNGDSTVTVYYTSFDNNALCVGEACVEGAGDMRTINVVKNTPVTALYESILDYIDLAYEGDITVKYYTCLNDFSLVVSSQSGGTITFPEHNHAGV